MSSVSMREVLDQELEQVETARSVRLGEVPQRPKAHDSLVGLAFSGGGIRSATFNLGVLQALAQARLLRAFDYVSTVSGGGYIGSWLMAWMHHQQIGIPAIEDRLAPQHYSPQNTADPPEVHFLRNYSNYLTPRKGILGADFWAFAASYLRNLLLNQTILVLLLLALLLLPRALVYIPHLLEAEEEQWGWRIPITHEVLASQESALIIGLLLGILAVVMMGINLAWVDPDTKKDDPWYTKQWAVEVLIVLPFIIGAALVSYGFGHFLEDWEILEHPYYMPPLIGMGLYFGLWALAFLVRWITRVRKAMKGPAQPATWLVLVTAAATGAIVGYLLLPYSKIVIPAGAPPGTTYDLWRLFTFGNAGLIGIILLAGVLHIGLMGRGMSDAHREWWGRLGGWILIYSLMWLLLYVVAIYAPAGIAKVWSTGHRTLAFTSSTVLWVLSTLYGILFGKSEHTAKPRVDAAATKKILGYVARATPYIFLAGLLLALSLLAAKIALWVADDPTPLASLPPDIVDPLVLAVFAGCVVFALVLSWRVDVNEFSVHHLYRNRLVRCYLGASVRGRDPQPFTGFSAKDDFPLTALQITSKQARNARPFPILNTSLNVVRGSELAMQTRKARSFAFTPLYSGFAKGKIESSVWEPAYALTVESGRRRREYKGGVSLGTAVAISGAAASPNMGFYSAPALAFLMTLFDVRLGWWMGNPAGDGWYRGSPIVGFVSLLSELLGSTNDNTRYVYLSDGGHFENLAVYELVRRGCKLIVACDASCDPAFGCGDLHNTIERCRTDFGVEIEVDTTPLRGKDGRAQSHFAMGAIHYDPASPDADGVLIYLKPALLESDPADVLGYAVKNPHFPNDTTANQWFDEAHFENYRALGEASGNEAAEAIRAEFERLMTTGRATSAIAD